MNKKLTKNQKNKITVIVALIMAVSCSWAAIQSMYYAIWMIAMDVVGSAYDIPSFGSMPKFLIGASIILFATAVILLKDIMEIIHTAKRSTMEEDNKNNLDELLDCTRNKRGGVTVIGKCIEDKD